MNTSSRRSTREIAQEAAEKRAAQAEVAALFAGSEKFELTERSGGLQLKAQIQIHQRTACCAWPDFPIRQRRCADHLACFRPASGKPATKPEKGETPCPRNLTPLPWPSQEPGCPDGNPKQRILESVGKRQAWTTLILTTAALTMAFITLVSGVGAGGPAAAESAFSSPAASCSGWRRCRGLLGGTLRLIHMFLVPIYGTRHVISLSTLSLLIPLVGWFYAVQNPATPPIGS